jgi:phytoene synthase
MSVEAQRTSERRASSAAPPAEVEPSPDEGPDADVERCIAALGAGSKSFRAASWLLPRALLERSAALYAFCREADDLVDEAEPEGHEAAPSHAGRAGDPLEGLAARLDAIYQGRPEARPTDRALARVVREARVPRLAFDWLLEGFAWDRQGRRYETLSELEAYCARVAGTVGVMMTCAVDGPRTAPVLARATDLGIAMQLGNVARDVGEDLGRGRVYLPEAWLREEGLSAEALLARPRFSPPLGRVVARLLARADELYARSERGIASLPEAARRAVWAARLVYAELGEVIARAGFDSVSSRAVVSDWRKVELVVRSLAASRRGLSLPHDDEPPAPAALALVVRCAEGPSPYGGRA